jgi:hypothetical protein
MVRVERLDRHLARTRKRQTLDVEARGLRGVAGKQSLDRRAMGANEAFAGVLRIGEARFEE